MSNVFFPEYVLEIPVVSETVLYLELPRRPRSVQIWSQDHELVHADVRYVDSSSELQVNWSIPFTGRVAISR